MRIWFWSYFQFYSTFLTKRTDQAQYNEILKTNDQVTLGTGKNKSGLYFCKRDCFQNLAEKFSILVSSGRYI